MTTRATVTRRAIRTPRAAAIAGILFALMLGTALILMIVAIPPDSRQAGNWVTDESSRRLVVIGVNLLPFAGIAFLWFIGVVRDRIGTGEDRFFATVFLGSGLLFVAMLFAAGADASALLVDPGGGADETTDAVWSYGRRQAYALITVYAMRMAGVFMMSTTTLALRLGFVPRWMVYTGFTGAVVLLLTTGTVPYVEFIFPLWVLALAVHILVVTMRQHPEEAEPPAAVVAS